VCLCVCCASDLHDDLEQRLSDVLAVLLGDGDAELGQHGLVHLLLAIHDGAEEGLDGREDEHAESAVSLLASLGGRLRRPLLGLVAEEVVAPQTLHHLGAGDSELGRVHVGELLDGEAPAVQTRAEADRSALGVHLHLAQQIVLVGRDDDVHGLDGAGEGLVALLKIHLQLYSRKTPHHGPHTKHALSKMSLTVQQADSEDTAQERV
jgi:hypothetical protein